MPGIKIIRESLHSEPQYFWGNIGAGILPICMETHRILVAYRSAAVMEGNTWGVWGGKIDEEDGETLHDIESVAIREFKEETEYDDRIKLIPAYVFKSANGSFTYHNFIGLLSEEFEPQLDWETEDFKWMTFEELIELKPKHFGLKALLADRKSADIIQQYAR